MTYRTNDQKLANEFDADLYRLIATAESRKGKGYAETLQLLRKARTPVRMLMHPADREGTEGL